MPHCILHAPPTLTQSPRQGLGSEANAVWVQNEQGQGLIKRRGVCRSQNGVNHLMGGTGKRKLDKFEELIRDAIALLIKQGKIRVPQKKPHPSKIKPRKDPNDGKF